MAMQEGNGVHTPSPEVVGCAFVEQYYHVLHHSPELVHRFYQDSSFMSRPDRDRSMKTVTTLEAINEKIQSLNYQEYTAEIKSADAQESFGKGVIVLVTGCLTGEDDVRKKFTQSFFLAPQDKGYFVLNDVMRYVEESDLPVNPLSASGLIQNDEAPAATNEQGSLDLPAVEQAIEAEEELHNEPEVVDPSDKEEGSIIDEEIVEPQKESSEPENLAELESAPIAHEDVPKKSYASILKAMRTAVHVPREKVRAAPAPADQQLYSPAKPVAPPQIPVSVTVSDSAAENLSVSEEVEGHSIYVRNLPFSATPVQLEEVFKKFGPIKHDGIQVRSNKQGFTFGFVEFESSSSVQSAMQASPIIIGDRQSVVEEKRANTRASSAGRGGKPSPGKGEFRNDSFRGRGGYGAGRGYTRNEFRNQGEFSGRSRGLGGRGGESYQRTNQNGGGRGVRQGGVKP